VAGTQTEADRIELVRSFYDLGWFNGDPSQIVAHADPEIEMVNPPEAVQGGTRHGVEELVEAWRNMVTTLDDSHHGLRKIEGHGDVVLAELTHSAILRDSELRIEQDEVHTWTFRGAKVIRFEWGRDAEAARRAAGF